MTRNFYVGTYTQSGSDGKVTGSRGIYLGRLDLETGKAELSPCAEESRNPSFLPFLREGSFCWRQMRCRKGALWTSTPSARRED